MGLLLVVIILGSVAISKTTWSMDDYWTLLLIGLIILPFFGLSGLLGATLRGLNYVVQAQLPEMLAMPAFHLILIVFLLSHGFLNQATALLSKAAAAAIALAIAAFLLHRHWPGQVRVSNAEYRNAQWACAWLPFTLLMAANLLNSEIGILLLGWLGTDEQVAALRLAYRGAQLVVISLSIVNLVIAPHVTQTHRSGNTTQLQQLSRQSARAALAGALPVAIPLIFWGAPIISFVFGAEYVNMTLTPLAILASAQLINVGFGSVGIFLTMSGFEKDTLCVQIISLMVNVASGILLIPKFGATGAACSGAMGLITWNILLGILFIQRLKIRPSAI
jgi:O-antigen/teichoic acid export membrane protein